MGGSPPNPPSERAREQLSASLSDQDKSSPHYTVTILATLGGSNNSANAVNERGSPAGTSGLGGDQVVHAFVAQQDGIRDLRTLGGSNSFLNEGHAVNASDAITGVSETTVRDPNAENVCGDSGYECRAFLWQRGTMTALPTLGGNNAEGVAINDRGQIIGFSETEARLPCQSLFLYVFKAFIFDRGRISALPLIPGDNAALGSGINDLGQAVGTSGFCSIARHSVLWQNGRVIDLGSLGGTADNLPSDINNRGEIVGESDIAGNTHHHAFLWRSGAISDLGTLPGDVDSSASSINNKGQIAGFSFDVNGNPRAVLWSDGVMWDLNTLVPPRTGLLLQESLGINDRGEIAGFGCVKCDGTDQRAFLAIPTQSSQAISTTRVTPTTEARKTIPVLRARNIWDRILNRSRARLGSARTRLFP
jgi:probable HAF family extracellular repeat protein